VPVLGWGEGGDTHCSLVDPLFPQIDRYAQQDLKKGLHLYGTEGNVGLTNAWSIIQTDVRIWCGRGRGQAAEAAGEGGSPLHLQPSPFLCPVPLLWSLQLHRLV
jgi:hypothetical protein